MMTENVVKLDTENLRVYDQIERYLNQHGYNSKKTAESYKGDIELFFKVIKQKEIQYLTEEDVQLELDDIEDFVKKLYSAKDRKKERIYSNKTINRKVSAIKNLLKYLCAKKVVKDVSFLHLIKGLPDDGEGWDALTVDEVLKMSELCLEEREKGEIKRMLLILALDTGIRKSSLLGLRWSNFKFKDEEIQIVSIDKGNKKYNKKISKPLYEDLLKIKTDSEYVFDIGKDAVDKMFQRVRKKMNFSDDRRISFHSIRKTAGFFIYNQTKDLDATRKYLNHSSPNTTVLYMGDNDFGANGAVSINDSIDCEMYKKVQSDLLIKAISELDSGTQTLINKKLTELSK